MPRKKKEDKVEKVAPKKEILENDVPTRYKMKDEFFDKIKSYKDLKTGRFEKVEANWRNLHLDGKKITIFKGDYIKESELVHFNEEAKKYYLELVVED